MVDIKKIKKELRNEMLVKRAKLNSTYKNEYDLWVCNQLEKVIEANNYQTVHAYLSMGKEINITPLLETLLAKGVVVVTPKTLPNRKLENRVLTSLSEVEQGVFGTKHPSNPNEYVGSFDLIIVPGLAFDKCNYRLGYGGGYYDNFIDCHPESKKIGVFYPNQQVVSVPLEQHDVGLDSVLINKSISL